MYPGGRGIEENGRTLDLMGIIERRRHGPVDVNRRKIAGTGGIDLARGMKRIVDISVSQAGTGYRVSFELWVFVDHGGVRPAVGSIRQD